MSELYQKLVTYRDQDYYPFHMPGHKRNEDLMSMINPYGIDLTEIDGFDNLHEPEEILLSLSNRISKLYGSVYSYPLVNGSTCGILAGISGATKRGDKVLIGRNCHKSIYHGILLRELEPVYLYPPKITGTSIFGGIHPELIVDMLTKHPDIKLVVITSPTYEGIVSDIKKIAEIVHQHGAYLLVDEAHGAHFGLDVTVPISAVSLGADIVIQSFHKTLPSFTQTAVLHLNEKKLKHAVETYLKIYQSSSPSYLLMSSIDQCIQLLESQRNHLFQNLNIQLEQFYKNMKKLDHIKVLSKDLIGRFGIYDIDLSKLVLIPCHCSISGKDLSRKLQEEYRIIMEMDAMDYSLGISTICDRKEGFQRLEAALYHIDKELAKELYGSHTEESMDIHGQQNYGIEPVMKYLPFEAIEKQKEDIRIEDSVGRIAGEQICIYPPGIPILVHGEVITMRIREEMEKALKIGLKVIGLTGEQKDRITVLVE